MMVEAEEPASGRVNSAAAGHDPAVVIAAAAAQAPHDVLDHHDGVVDDQPDRRRHAAQRHDVEAHVQDVEQQHGRGQHGGTAIDGDQRDLEVAQEEQQHSAASTTPMRMASRTLPAEATISSLWSYQLAIVTPAGRCGR